MNRSPGSFVIWFVLSTNVTYRFTFSVVTYIHRQIMMYVLGMMEEDPRERITYPRGEYYQGDNLNSPEIGRKRNRDGIHHGTRVIGDFGGENRIPEFPIFTYLYKVMVMVMSIGSGTAERSRMHA